jgi:hypothetical protein
MSLVLRAATRADVPVIRELIEGLADYEKLRHECIATDALLAAALFGARPSAEVVIAEWDGASAGFALFFHNPRLATRCRKVPQAPHPRIRMDAHQCFR